MWYEFMIAFAKFMFLCPHGGKSTLSYSPAVKGLHGQIDCFLRVRELVELHHFNDRVHSNLSKHYVHFCGHFLCVRLMFWDVYACVVFLTRGNVYCQHNELCNRGPWNGFAR